MTLGAFVGSLGAGPISTYINRRWSLFIASVLCCIAVIVMITTTHIGALYFGRLLLGIAKYVPYSRHLIESGFFMTFTQLYIQECSPPHIRGAMLVMFQFWISIGSTIGTIVDNYTATISGKLCYQIPLALLFIVPVLLTLTSPFIPDSPRWLISHGKPEEALLALRKLRGSFYHEKMIAEEFQEIKESWAIEQQLAESVSIYDMFRGTDLRRTILSFLAVCFQASSGSMFLLIYGTYFFLMSGSTQPFQDSIIVSCIGLLAVMMMTVIIRYLSRRTILLLAFVVQAVSMLIIAIIYTAAPTSGSALKCLVAFVCIYIFFYGGWTSPTAWLVAGEIPSTRLRSYTLGFGASGGFLFGWVIAFTAPYFINPLDLNWGPKYGYIWFVSNLITFLFILFFLPETKDRTLEEIDELFHNKVAARKFSTYECVASEQAREHGANKLGEKGTLEQVESVNL
jgi:SP family sugar:H+ symporter-like MFS transporter